MTKKQHRWTQEELDIIRRDYRQNMASKRELADKLGVTVNAVAGQIQKMGIAKRDDRFPWDPKQDDLLREIIYTHSPYQIAKIMRRSVNSVVVRSKRLKLHRRNRNGWYTKAEVCEILGMDHKRLQRRIDSGALPARPHNPDSKPGKLGMAIWHIDEEDLRRFIRRFPEELNGRNVDIIQIVDIIAGLDNSAKVRG